MQGSSTGVSSCEFNPKLKCSLKQRLNKLCKLKNSWSGLRLGFLLCAKWILILQHGRQQSKGIAYFAAMMLCPVVVRVPVSPCGSVCRFRGLIFNIKILGTLGVVSQRDQGTSVVSFRGKWSEYPLYSRVPQSSTNFLPKQLQLFKDALECKFLLVTLECGVDSQKGLLAICIKQFWGDENSFQPKFSWLLGFNSNG